MRISLLLACAGAALLAGCVSNRPVEGVVRATGEKFTGVATGSLDSAGSVEIVSQQTTCRGTFSNPTGAEAMGTFTCKDGRSGPFRFSPRDRSGSARLGAQAFIFTFS